jgi:hypothetical protein
MPDTTSGKRLPIQHMSGGDASSIEGKAGNALDAIAACGQQLEGWCRGQCQDARVIGWRMSKGD